MNYVEKSLRRDEQVVTKAKISFWWLFPSILRAAVLIALGVVLKSVLGKGDSAINKVGGTYNLSNLGTYLMFALCGVAALIIIWKIIIILTTHLVITNKRVLGKQGVISIKTMDVPIEKVDNISYEGGVLGNIFHYYKTSIKSTSSEFDFKGISNAQEFKNRLMDAIDNRASDLRKAQAAELAAAMNSKKD